MEQFNYLSIFCITSIMFTINGWHFNGAIKISVHGDINGYINVDVGEEYEYYLKFKKK